MTALLNFTAQFAYEIGVGVILCLAFVWWLWHQRRKIKSSARPQLIETEAEIADGSAPDQCDLDPKLEHADETSEGVPDYPPLLSKIAGSCGEPSTRSFLDEVVHRVREEAPKFGDDTPFDFIEEIVDRIDDLNLLITKASVEDASCIDQFSKLLKELLGACGVELLHSNSWNPDIQRALAKTPTEGISEPKITSYGSTGISHHSKLTRKQEVQLAVPSDPTTYS